MESTKNKYNLHTVKEKTKLEFIRQKNQLMTFVLHGILTPISIQYTIVFVLMLSCDITTNKYAVYVNNTMCTVFNAGVNAVLTNTVVFPLCSTYQCQRLETNCI